MFPADTLSAVIHAKDIVERALSSFDRLNILLHLAKLDGPSKDAVKALISQDGLLQQLYKELTEVEEAIRKKRRRKHSREAKADAKA